MNPIVDIPLHTSLAVQKLARGYWRLGFMHGRSDAGPELSQSAYYAVDSLPTGRQR